MIGFFGLGKINFINNLGFDFFLKEKLGIDLIYGVGGMWNCDWWFINKVVIIDIVGCYIM